MTLVPYSDSEDEEERRRLPALQLSNSGSQDEWLSHIYIPSMYFILFAYPVPVDDKLQRLLEQCDGIKWALLPTSEPLHISLTRPILLRKYEQPWFVQQAAISITESHTLRYAECIHTVS